MHFPITSAARSRVERRDVEMIAAPRGSDIEASPREPAATSDTIAAPARGGSRSREWRRTALISALFASGAVALDRAVIARFRVSDACVRSAPAHPEPAPAPAHPEPAPAPCVPSGPPPGDSVAIASMSAEVRRIERLAYGSTLVDRRVYGAFVDALRYLARSPANERTIRLLTQSAMPGNVSLKIDRGRESAFNHLTTTIGWNDTGKLAFRDPRSPGGIGVNSPANVLMHEMLHVEHALTNPVASIVRLSFMHPEFDNLEEKKTIEELNARNAAFVGEANRTSHHESPGMISARNATDATTAGVPSNALETYAARRDFYATGNVSRYLDFRMTETASRRDFYAAARGEPESFNRTVLPRIEARMRAAAELTRRYADTVRDGAPDPRLAARVAAFSREAEAFAERMVYDKPTSSADGAVRSTSVPREPRPRSAPPLAPDTAPSAQGAPEPPRA